LITKLIWNAETTAFAQNKIGTNVLYSPLFQHYVTLLGICLFGVILSQTNEPSYCWIFSINTVYSCISNIADPAQRTPSGSGPVFTKKPKMRIRLRIKLINSHNLLKNFLNLLKFALVIKEVRIDIAWLSYQIFNVWWLILILDLILIKDQDQS